MKYIQQARSPDGRDGTFDTFHAWEGDPFCLMEDAEQDAICEVLERL